MCFEPLPRAIDITEKQSPTKHIRRMANSIQIQELFTKGFHLHQRGDLANAWILYQQVSALEPQHFDALHMRAIVQLQTGHIEIARTLFIQAIGLNPLSDSAHLNLALVEEKMGHWAEAHGLLEQAIRLNDRNATAWNNKGSLLNKTGAYSEALRCFENAIDLNPGYAEALTNRANALLKLGRVDDALTGFEAALNASPPSSPSQIQANCGMGLIYKQKSQLDLAKSCFDKVIAGEPSHADAHFNLGMIHHERKEYALALAAYETAARLKPNIDYLDGYHLYAKNAICDWSDSDTETHHLEQGIHAGHKAAPPFGFLSIFESAKTQYMAAGVIAADLKHREAFATPPPKQQPQALPTIATQPGKNRIRIGYLSCDFRLHAVARLIVELIELHDRSIFEVYGFCWSPEDGSALQSRIRSAFDHFVKIHTLTDAQAAEMIDKRELDVLVDLQGMTNGARPGILMRRPANAIQISYLGMPGTSGLPSLDYIVGDEFIFPRELESFMSEKPLRVPVCFQVSDRQRASGLPMKRADCGLPDGLFVFAVFNNSYKINPALFQCWMRILKATPLSCLWLVHDNAAVVENLRREAASAGIDPDRLIFSAKTSTEEYMSRLALPDLALDTFPYNAGTIANDLLWMGTPILTLSGACYASRMCGSLLAAVGAPELIAYSLSEYEKKAISLAQDRAFLMAFRNRMAARDQPLFDTPSRVKDYENAIARLFMDEPAMVERLKAGQAQDPA